MNADRMNEFQNHWSKTIARRVLFVVALLSIGPICGQISYYLFMDRRDAMQMLMRFLIGINAFSLPMAVWLVARSRVWTSWQGWLRTGLYLMAYVYGCMLAQEVVLMNMRLNGKFTMPTLWIDSLGPAASGTLLMLLLAWLLTPLVFAFSARLSTNRDEATSSWRFSISALLIFIGVAAASLGLFQLLTSRAGLRLIGYDGSTTKDFVTSVLEVVPFHLPAIVATMLMLYVFSKRWWWAIAVLPVAIGIEFGLLKLISMAVLQVSKLPSSNEAGIGKFGWCFITGRAVTLWSALCTARLLGVRPYFGRRKEEAREPQPVVSPIDVD
ncbi:hypothetical protein GC197_03265 [bacterium]|nr:hypothetical protein [bacterium]